MSRDDVMLRVARLIAAGERLHAAVEAAHPWLKTIMPGQLPAPMQRLVDAAATYESDLNDIRLILSERENSNKSLEKKG